MQRKVELTFGGGKRVEGERVERKELIHEDLAMSVYAARSTPGQFIFINQEIAFFAWGILSGFSALLISKSCE